MLNHLASFLRCFQKNQFSIQCVSIVFLHFLLSDKNLTAKNHEISSGKTLSWWNRGVRGRPSHPLGPSEMRQRRSVWHRSFRRSCPMHQENTQRLHGAEIDHRVTWINLERFLRLKSENMKKPQPLNIYKTCCI